MELNKSLKTDIIVNEIHDVYKYVVKFQFIRGFTFISY